MEPKKASSRTEQILSAVSLAGLIDGFRNYINTYRDVLKYRGRYADICLIPDTSTKINLAISVYLYGVIICFLIVISVGQLHDISMSKIYFLLWYVYWQILIILVSHIAAKTARGNGSLLDTTTTCCIFYGVFFPFGIFLLAPLLVYIPLEDLGQNSNTNKIDLTKNQIWFIAIWFITVSTISLIIWVMVGLRWIATVHNIKLRWLFVTYLIIYIPFTIFHNRFITPLINQVLHFLSDLLTSLV